MDKTRCRKPLGEPDEIVAGSPGECIDRLVLVTDDGEIVPPAQPGVEERLLERVGVLVFIHREPAVAVSDLVGDARIALDQPDRQLQHVLEVDASRPPLRRLVTTERPAIRSAGSGASRPTSTALAS